MVFIRYQHVERINTDESMGLLDGTCHIFPKMDGSNMGVYSEDSEIRMMSRNRELDGSEPFAKFAVAHDGIRRFVKDFPGMRLYGEWMVPHTVRSYVPEVWNRWFVFDMTAEFPDRNYTYIGVDGEEHTLDCDGRTYIPYEEYVPILEAYGIDYIPCIDVLENPAPECLAEYADVKNTWMMSTGCGEGIVVKRYGFVNAYGRTSWAKVINVEFASMSKGLRVRNWQAKHGDVPLEYTLIREGVTPDLVNKEYEKIRESTEKVEPGRLLGMVWHEFFHEELWDLIRKHKNPTVNFNVLRKECDLMVKIIRPEVFGLTKLDVRGSCCPDDIH